MTSDANVLLSVIIVNYNSKIVLEPCLRSVMRACQSLAYELIVVDNASTDGSAHFVRTVFPLVRLIENHENAGFSSANNLALRTAGGRYVLFLNPDTMVKDHAVARMLEYLENHPECAAVGPKLLKTNGDMWLFCRRLPSFWAECCAMFYLNRLFPGSELFAGRLHPRPNRVQACPVECLSGAAILSRTAWVVELKGFDESVPLFLDDIDLCARLSRYGAITYLPAAEIIHHGGVCVARQEKKAMVQLNVQARYAYLAKHRPVPEAALFIFLVFCRSLIGLSLFWLLSFFHESQGFAVKKESHRAQLEWVFTNKSLLKLPNGRG